MAAAARATSSCVSRVAASVGAGGHGGVDSEVPQEGRVGGDGEVVAAMSPSTSVPRTTRVAPQPT